MIGAIVLEGLGAEVGKVAAKNASKRLVFGRKYGAERRGNQLLLGQFSIKKYEKAY